MSRGCRRWYLRRIEQETRSRIRRDASGRHADVRRQGLPARKRVVRFHRRLTFEHGRSGFPTVRLRSLASVARRSVRIGHETIQRRTGKLLHLM